VPSEDQKDVTFKKKKETSSVFDSLKKSLLNSSLILNHSKLKHSPQFKNGAEKENLPTMSLQY
jgi:hypothetical protein